jgi:iron uptake system component EfeO
MNESARDGRMNDHIGLMTGIRPFLEEIIFVATGNRKLLRDFSRISPAKIFSRKIAMRNDPVTKQHTELTILHPVIVMFCGGRGLAVARSLGTMIHVRVAVCLALLGLGMRAASAAPLDVAAEDYRPYMIEGIGQALAGARELRERAAAGDLNGAKKAWISARAGWERSEVFTAGFAPELDAQIDAWPNADSGFHAIEAKLFGAGLTDVDGDGKALVEHLDSLHGKLRDIPLTPQGLLDGTVRLAYEVGESKADGGESRISGTSLDDMRNNVAGIDFACHAIFAPALRTADAGLAGALDARIELLKAIVAAPDLRHVDVSALRRASEELVITLQGASDKLGLRRSTLEAASR